MHQRPIRAFFDEFESILHTAPRDSTPVPRNVLGCTQNIRGALGPEVLMIMSASMSAPIRFWAEAMSHFKSSGRNRELSSYLLRYQSGLNGAEDIVLRRGNNTIGRSDDCDIVISDGTVSRRHARIAVNGARVFVYDLKSQNGTFIEDARISQGMLRVGNKLRLGLLVLQLVSLDNEFTEDVEDVETDRVDPEPKQRPTIPERYSAILSPRQREILDLIVEGSPDKQVATQVGISIHTVRHHLKEIYRVLDVNSRTMLLAKILGQHKNFANES